MSSRSSRTTLKNETKSKTPYKKALSTRKGDPAHGVYSKMQSSSIIPQEANHDWVSIHKYAIKDQIKHFHLGIRPSKLGKPLTLGYIEELYSKLSKLQSKKFYQTISDQDTFSKFIYRHFVPSDKGPSVDKQNEKVLVNFINSLELYSEESKSCLLFGKV